MRIRFHCGEVSHGGSSRIVAGAILLAMLGCDAVGLADDDARKSPARNIFFSCGVPASIHLGRI